MAKYSSKDDILHVKLTTPDEKKIFRLFLDQEDDGMICQKCGKHFDVTDDMLTFSIPRPLAPELMFGEVVGFPTVNCPHCNAEQDVGIMTIDGPFPQVLAVVHKLQEKAGVRKVKMEDTKRRIIGD